MAKENDQHKQGYVPPRRETMKKDPFAVEHQLQKVAAADREDLDLSAVAFLSDT